MSEPTTEAGRALLAWLLDDPCIVSATPDSILAIEAEARADALREAAERVRAVAHDPHGCNGLHVELEEGIRAILTETKP